MDVTEALKLLDQAIAALALPPPQALTAKQRKAATRSRKGMERVVPTLANLSTEHGVCVPKQPTSTMTSQLALVTQLESVQQKLTSGLTLVGNTIDAARSGSWNTATTLYGMLQKVAHRDPQLGSQLAPVKEFFAYRTPGAKKAHPKRKKKGTVANETQPAAQATVESSPATATEAPAAAAATPGASSAPASTNANAAPVAAPAASSVVTTHP